MREMDHGVRCPPESPRQMPRASSKCTGFTAMPLLIALVIAGLLATVAVPRITETQSRMRANAMKIDLRNLYAAEQAYYADSSRYADARTLVRLHRFAGSGRAALPVVTIGPRDWSATVTYREDSGAMCAISLNTTNPISGTAQSGEPICNLR